MTDHTALELLLHGVAEDWATLSDPTRSDLDREVAALRLTSACDHVEAKQYTIDGLAMLPDEVGAEVNLIMLNLSMKILNQMAVELRG